MIARPKRIYILMFKVSSQVVFSITEFSKRNRKQVLCVFIGYRNTCEGLGELEKAVEILTGMFYEV